MGRPGNLHFTLKFLGEVPAEQTAAICQAVAAAVAETAAFDLEIHGAGAFPNAARPRTVWIGSAAGKDEMVALQGRVDKALKKLGYAPEHRPVSPHLTIGRVRGGGPALAQLGQRIRQHADEPLGTMTVRAVTVFSSELSRTGPAYTPSGGQNWLVDCRRKVLILI